VSGRRFSLGFRWQITRNQQYSKRGYLPALKFAFGHGMGTFWARSRFLAVKFDFSEGKRGKSELMLMPERQ
jgi:hypothetical protein